jgi:hypothetical protein
MLWLSRTKNPGRMVHEAARFYQDSDWHGGGGVADFIARGELSIAANHADRAVRGRRPQMRIKGFMLYRFTKRTALSDI